MDCFLCGVAVQRSLKEVETHIKSSHAVSRNMMFVVIIFLLDFMEISDLVRDFKSRLDELKTEGEARVDDGEVIDVEIVEAAGSEGYQRLENLIRPQTTEEEKLKRKLKFFFMNPVEKYYATR